MCNTTYTREYLPKLKVGSVEEIKEAQENFIDDFFDCCFGSASSTWRTLDEHERIESVHDAFLKIFDAAKAGILPDLTGPYVHTAVFLQCKNRALRRKRRHDTVPLCEDDIPPVTDPSANDIDLDEILTAAALTDEETEILRLRFRDGYTIEEIAYGLGLSPGTVRNRIARALKKLRHHLDDTQDGETPLPA
jgi:RNA polymerase sigma factor (sigma-70 family)